MHVRVDIEKFKKWIEYKPVTTSSADCVVEFICDILYRFVFPNTIIIDLDPTSQQTPSRNSANGALPTSSTYR